MYNRSNYEIFDTSFKLCLYDLRVSQCKFKHVLKAQRVHVVFTC